MPDIPLKTSTELLDMKAEELVPYMAQICAIYLPEKIDSIEEMKYASGLLSKTSSLYSFTSNLALTSNIRKRNFKKEKKKTEYEEEIAREMVFNSFSEQLKMNYNTVSRMFSIKQQISQELKMLGETI